jgi:predicted ABC-type ATPase
LWLIAGPNGSGKSSLYGSEQNAIYGDTNIADSAHSFWIINPDLLTLRIQAVEKKSLEESNLEALRRIEAWLLTSVDAHQSVGVETVLSTGKDWALVFDNSEALRLVGRKADGVVTLDPTAPDAIKAAVSKIGA